MEPESLDKETVQTENESPKPESDIPTAPQPLKSQYPVSPTPVWVYVLTFAIVIGILFFSYRAVRETSDAISSGVLIDKLDSYLEQQITSPSENTSNTLTKAEKAREANAKGWAAFLAKDYKTAEPLFLEAIELDSTFALPYNNVALVYDQQEKNNLAKEYYEKSIAADPTYVKPVNNLGYLYSELGEYKKSMEYYQRAIEVDNTWSMTYQNMGRLYLYQGRVNRGLEAYQQAIVLDSPNSAELNQILDNFKQRPMPNQTFDVIPPDNMSLMQGSASPGKENGSYITAKYVYGERAPTEQSEYLRTFYVDITANGYIGPRDHGELFGPREGREAIGYEFYGLPADSTIVTEEQTNIVVDGLPATYTRYSSPNNPEWYGEAVVIPTDQYEYFIHNGGKRDDRFREFYETFRYELGQERTILGDLIELQNVSIEGGSELKLLASKSVSDQETKLQKKEGCIFPEFETVDLVLEHGGQWFEIKDFGVPKKRAGEWQTISYPVNLGLVDKDFDLVWSPITRMGKNTFLIPNFNTLRTPPELVSNISCYADFEYEVFYYDQGVLKRQGGEIGTYPLRGLLLDRDIEIKPFCFNGCG